MKSLWSHKEASTLDDLGLLVYASRLLGQNPALVVWGGGNSSAKGRSKDLRDREVATIWVKGSGSDMKSCAAKDFTPLRLEDLLAALEREEMTDEAMVDYFGFAKTNPSAPRPSIETLLHAFVPRKFVLHTHADAILALTNNQKGRLAVEQCFSGQAIFIPYIKPGFTLAKMAAKAFSEFPGARAMVLENHGLITWDDDARTAYEATIEFVTKAEQYSLQQEKSRPTARAISRLGKALSGGKRREIFEGIAPALRGALSAEKRNILRFEDGAEILEFLEHPGAEKSALAGPATPDHMLQTKRLPLFLGRPKLDDVAKLSQQLREAVATYREEYLGYWQRNHRASDPMLEPFPRVLLIPGLGLIATGKDAKQAAVVAEIYSHSIDCMRAALRIAAYKSLSEAQAYEMEYWPLELYKLALAPAEKEFSRKVALITGAASGIGKAIAWRFAEEGTHLLLGDRDGKGVSAVADAIGAKYGRERIFAAEMDVTSEKSVYAAFADTVTRFGGLDIVISNAGIAASSPIDTMRLEDWEKSLAVNATGHFLVAREGLRLFKNQGLGGVFVFNASKNVLAPGKDFAAYSAAKSAEAQLAKIVAIEGAPFGIRANLLHPDAIFEDSKLWSPEIRAQRAKAQGIKPSEIEEAYRKRNLLQVTVSGRDVAEAALFFASDRSAKTTGCALTIDGGLREAFPR